ncbi:MAG: MotA/TolQ/ExbB proton channel family protein [Bacteroidota bacterium]
MFDFLIEGWAPITFPMTILLIIAVALIIRSLIVRPELTKEQSLTQIGYIKYLGILSLTIGLFGQILGLYGAFTAMEQAGEVSQAIFFGGMKVSSITTVYGMSIFLICYLSWLILKVKTDRQFK